ncbi:Mediator of RNA polymerase II transcription subunit 23 [Rhynchospora pubera]|uniref:Mediator of RNA polymerase II transcription subunit 23 n=1 Tax=Rhynchospora pubera TaxID=906938 RepID=A0AAV8DGX0_9POAL|nr:Mediator of RNA polymerase II transcription subunit 23 [Rhynchospora pubera]
MDPNIGKITETEPKDSKNQVGKSKEQNEENGNSNKGCLQKDHTIGDIEMEAEITPEDVEKAGGFGARDDISSLLPATIDATDLEESLLDARGFEEEGSREGEAFRPGIGWTGPSSDK